nr:MAG TPA: hypothetical protein [Caudoviricetes sp.]
MICSDRTSLIYTSYSLDGVLVLHLDALSVTKNILILTSVYQ